MSISLQWEPHGVVRTVAGTVHWDEFMASVVAVQNDARFDRLRYAIEDFSGIETVDLNQSDLDMVTAMTIGAAFSNPHIRIAVVATLAPVRQLAHSFSRTSPYVTRLFAQLAQAREWINAGDISAVPLDIQLQAAVRTGRDQPMA